jgi:hypothetical protein
VRVFHTSTSAQPPSPLRRQEYICEPATCAAADVAASLDACVALLRKLHDSVPAADFKRPRDRHTFDVFETAQCVCLRAREIKRIRENLARARVQHQLTHACDFEP